ncbi:MAG: helix-hairpin-helix domain-containing protein [Burkholderiales bacterium]|nr:helix-hairpin-helix domain-containing protein [Burkholderiales bacterium]
MFKRILAGLLAVVATAVIAAQPVDINKADQAQLESVAGIGPAMAGKILAERKHGAFKDWADVIDRVSGIGDGNAARFAAGGLTVNGAGYSGGSPAKAAGKSAKADKGAEKAADKAGEKARVAKGGKAD